MIKKAIFFTLLSLFIVHLAWTQNQVTYPKDRMQFRADSVTRITDSLINSQIFFHFVFESKYEGDTTTYYRHYYIDTLNRYLVKCIIDTTFADYYKRTFKQSVIYFNQGYEFKSCWNENRGTDSDICSWYNIYPEENEIAPQSGKLNESWTKETLDKNIKTHVRAEISDMKFMQKRNYD